MNILIKTWAWETAFRDNISFAQRYKPALAIGVAMLSELGIGSIALVTLQHIEGAL